MTDFKHIEEQIALMHECAGDQLTKGMTRNADVYRMTAHTMQTMLDVVRAADYWSLGMSVCACHCDRCRSYAIELGGALDKLKDSDATTV